MTSSVSTPPKLYEFSNNEVDGNVYRRLVAPDHADTTKVTGDAAASWTVSPDGKVFTFKLRPDVVFASGKAATAEDVAFSLQRVVKLNKTPGFILTQFGFTKDNVDSLIKAVDAQTLHFELPAAQSTSFVLFCLSANVGSIVEKATVMANEVNGDMGNGWMKTHSAGAGGYALTSYAASDHVTIDFNPHSGIKTSSKRVIIRHVADPSAQLLMLQKGDADIVRNLTPDQLKTISGNADFHVTSSPQSSQIYIALNQNVPDLAKPQVRQAVKWAIDYDAIATNITPNSYVVSQSFLPAGLPGALTDKPFRKDVARGEGTDEGSRTGRRVLGDNGLSISAALCRHRAGSAGRPGGDRDQDQPGGWGHQAGHYQDTGTTAPDGDAILGHRLLRSKLQRAGVLRQSG